MGRDRSRIEAKTHAAGHPGLTLFENPALPRGLGAVALLWYLVVLVRTAWHCDDAFIAFRTADNLCRGLGAVWNPGQRVQSYTSPLWMLISAGLRGLTGEFYFTMLIVSILLAGAGAALLLFRSHRPGRAAAVLLALSASAAVVDYSTSGLENPLLFVTLVLLVEHSARLAGRRLIALSLAASVLTLIRPDALLFVLPLLGWALLRRGRERGWGRAAGELAAGLSPILLWEAFCVLYYGSPVPNTAVAKLNLDMPRAVLVQQGMRYLADALRHDPVTLLLIILGAGAALGSGKTDTRLLGAGVVLYAFYVVWVGGDFMAGRFLAAPAVAAAALLLSVGNPFGSLRLPRAGRYGRYGLALVILAYGLLWPQSRWTSGAGFGASLRPEQNVRAGGIADERSYYYPSTGLLPVLGHWREIHGAGLPVPPYRGARAGVAFRSDSTSTMESREIGFFGYFAGPGKTIVDHWALADPLLARIPFRPGRAWRIGHYPRRLPAGYLETLRDGTNQIADPEMARLYDAIRKVTRDPLLAPGRWGEIWRLNNGHYASAERRREYL